MADGKYRSCCPLLCFKVAERLPCVSFFIPFAWNHHGMLTPQHFKIVYQSYYFYNMHIKSKELSDTHVPKHVKLSTKQQKNRMIQTPNRSPVTPLFFIFIMTCFEPTRSSSYFEYSIHNLSSHHKYPSFIKSLHVMYPSCLTLKTN